MFQPLHTSMSGYPSDGFDGYVATSDAIGFLAE